MALIPRPPKIENNQAYTHRAMLFVCALVLAAFVGGIVFERKVSIHWVLEVVGIRKPYIHNIEDRTQVPFEQVEQSAVVLLTAGQSNAANHSSFLQPSVHPNVVNFFAGALYVAREPLLGASGVGGNVLTTLGNLLLSTGDAKRVILAPHAIGPGNIADWLPGSRHFRRISASLTELGQRFRGPLILIWMQGGKDVREGMSPSELANNLTTILQALTSKHDQLQVLLSTHTRCRAQPSLGFSNVDDEVAALVSRVHSGPRLDALNNEHRYDGCHWNHLGVEVLTKRYHQHVQRLRSEL